MSSVRSSRGTGVVWFAGAFGRGVPISSQPWQAGLGFGGVPGVRRCPFHCIVSVLALLPGC